MRYYRGYVKAKGKKAVEKFKDVPDEKLRTLEQAKVCESYAGVLAPGVVLIDFDIKEHSEIAYEIVQALDLQCRIIKSDKGYHFLFADNGRFDGSKSRLRLACGLEADIKLGTRNSYESLKVYGKERQMVQDSDDPDLAPPFFIPIETDIKLLEMEDGDGRNDVLFRYILTLQSHGFTKTEIRRTINVINRFVFTEPLPQSEINTILRDEAFKPETEIVPSFTDEKGRVLHNLLGDYLVKTLNIVKVDGSLHIFKDGIYVRGEKRIEREMVKLVPGISSNKRKETYKYMDLIIEDELVQSDARYIAFKNGVYDVINDELLPFSSEIILKNKIPHDYNPNVRDETLIKVMNNITCGNPKLFDLLCEMVGYTMWRKPEMGWSFFCLGNRANGKSTFLDTLVYMLGNENVSALDFRDLGADFKSHKLFGMLANIGDDIADDYINDVSVFKKVATGNLITANPKYEEPFEFRPYATLIFSANVMPRLNDRTNAAARRIIPIPFKATFNKNSPDYDPFIKYKLQTPEAMATLINLGLNALKRIIETHEYTRCEEVDAELRIIEETNNPLIVFLKETKIEDEMVNDIYAKYVWWSSNAGVKSMSKQSFVKQVEEQSDLVMKATQIDDRVIEIFTKGE